MARHETVTLTCDLPHPEEAEGERTIRFGLAGAAYEIDVCGDHASELCEVLEEHARRGRRATSRDATPAPAAPPPISPRKIYLRDVRDWAAKEHLRTDDARLIVSDRGRIPSVVMQMYRQANG